MTGPSYNPITATPRAHEFDSTSDAYAASQVSDEISNGDVLVIRSERVVGVLVGAWPVAVTHTSGAFHELADDADWSALSPLDPEDDPYDYSVSVALARSVAGLEI